jgi:heme a synthase
MATQTLPVSHPSDARARPRAIAAWLIAVAVLVFAMVVVGGITRLTESGLSMVKWEPVSGIVPPLTDAAWQASFDAYKASPQYAQVNAGMTLAAFKGIYFWEYIHRALARMIGVAFALPLAWFAWTRAIPKGFGWRLAGILTLGGLQGAIGWWMVASGLIDKPAVAHERLATHLVTALLIISACIWTALDLTTVRAHAKRPTMWIAPFLVLLGVQIIWGAFTAGLRAGHASDTWPLMFGQIVPPGLASLIDDPVSVQFVHRSLAWAVAGAALWVAVRLYRTGAGPRALALGAMMLLQFSLGVATILSGVAIPIAVAHQAGAALLLATTLVAAHWCWRGRDA